MYRVKDVMTDEVSTCRVDESVEVAVQIMKDRGCGCVPVVDEKGRVHGLVTDRDAVMCALRLRKTLAQITAGEACSRSLITCEAGDALIRAELLMRVNRVRRLPVLGPDRSLVGVISLTDLARHVEVSTMASQNGLSPRQVAALLAETSGGRKLDTSIERPGSQQAGPHPSQTIFQE